MTTIALAIGLIAVNTVQPGKGVQIGTEQNPAPLTHPRWQDFIVHFMPESIVKAMADNEVLQIVVFSVFFALAVLLMGEKGKPIIDLCELLSEVMFKFTNIIMYLAPVGAGAAMAFSIASNGVQTLKSLALLPATLYAALATLFIVFILVMLIFKIPVREFISYVRDPAILAFSTASSESAMPLAMEQMEKFGVPPHIVSFVLPLGYSFNLDGTTLYLSLAAIFAAQVANIHLSLGQQLSMMVTLMVTSKGVAGVPRASLVILSGTLASFNLPVAAISLILGIDAFMDMGRTMVNVVGNCLASVVVAKWEGVFQTPVLTLVDSKPESVASIAS
jgi:proton glutamate symport protein